MSGINKVILIGNLGKDPESKTTTSGALITNIAIATSESWKDKSTGEKVEKTEWHRVTFFNKQAEIVGQHFKKGSKIYVEGSLTTRKWQDEDGSDRYSTEIKGREFQFLDSKNTNTVSSEPAFERVPPQQPMNNGASGFGGGRAPQMQHPAVAMQSVQHQPVAADDFDDDIPF